MMSEYHNAEKKYIYNDKYLFINLNCYMYATSRSIICFCNKSQVLNQFVALLIVMFFLLLQLYVEGLVLSYN